MYNSKAGFIFMKKKCAYADCKNKVVGELSMDIDLPKFPFCKKHKSNVQISIVAAVIGDMKLSDIALGLKNKRHETKSGTSAIRRK